MRAAEDVERIGVDEPAVVVADVDDDAVPRDVVGVEVDVQLRQRSGRHVGHVDVAEPIAARPRDVGAAFRDPLPIAQAALGYRRDRTHRHVASAFTGRGLRDPQHGAPVHLVLEQRVEVDARADRLAVHRDEKLPALDPGAERRRPERDDAGDLQRA